MYLQLAVQSTLLTADAIEQRADVSKHVFELMLQRRCDRQRACSFDIDARAVERNERIDARTPDCAHRYSYRLVAETVSIRQTQQTLACKTKKPIEQNGSFRPHNTNRAAARAIPLTSQCRLIFEQETAAKKKKKERGVTRHRSHG